ncbi:fimbrial assembly protein, partial [Serratia marcescens]
ALISGERTDWLLADSTRAVGQTYTMDISVTPVLAADIPTADKVELDGSVTLNFVFGL